MTPITESVPGPEQLRLEVLVGEWRTEGWVRDGEQSVQIQATDVYEWMPGRWAVLHRVDARVGDVRVEGAEIIGYDPVRETYATLYFGSDGPARYDAMLGSRDGVLTWSMRGTRNRFTGVFGADHGVLTGYWELLDESAGWQHWMDVTLTRQPGMPA